LAGDGKSWAAGVVRRIHCSMLGAMAPKILQWVCLPGFRAGEPRAER